MENTKIVIILNNRTTLRISCSEKDANSIDKSPFAYFVTPMYSVSVFGVSYYNQSSIQSVLLVLLEVLVEGFSTMKCSPNRYKLYD